MPQAIKMKAHHRLLTEENVGFDSPIAESYHTERENKFILLLFI